MKWDRFPLASCIKLVLLSLATVSPKSLLAWDYQLPPPEITLQGSVHPANVESWQQWLDVGYIGYQDAGSLTVTSGSINVGQLYVGYEGQGTLIVEWNASAHISNAVVGLWGDGLVAVHGGWYSASLNCSFGSFWVSGSGWATTHSLFGRDLHIGGFLSSFDTQLLNGTVYLTGHWDVGNASFFGSSWIMLYGEMRATSIAVEPWPYWQDEPSLTVWGWGKIETNRFELAEASTLWLEVWDQPVLIVEDVWMDGEMIPGVFENEGHVILQAGDELAPGVYTPIVATSWEGEGTFEAIGGVWDATRHVFAVGHAANENISVNWAESRQVPIYDVNTGSYVVVEFTGGGSGSGQLRGESASGDVLQALQSVAGAPVAAAWLFDVTNYPTGSTAWLSFFVGPGYSHDLFRYWHWDGTRWDPFNPEESSYDGGYVRFKIPGFSGYGVSILPEPNALGILGSLAIGLAGYWWVRSRRRPNTAAAPSDHAG